MLEDLHADAVAVLTRWSAPNAAAAADRDRTLSLLTAGPAAMIRDHAPGHVTASAMIVDAAAERVLLCLHGKIHRWVQVGGHCESTDPSLAAAALREATEESGIAGLALHPEPIGVDIHAVGCLPAAAGVAGAVSYHHDVRFAAVAPPGAVEAVSAESHALGWFTPGALPSPLASATEPLVAPALAVARAMARTAPRAG